MHQQYTARIQKIIDQLRDRNPLPSLAPNSVWNQQLVDHIQNTSLGDLFDGLSVTKNDFGQCVQSGLLLWADALDPSHDISQHIQSKTGSYWHGIMHRREPDYSNSKYWFGRVGDHPVFPELQKEAMCLLATVNDKSVDLSKIEDIIKNNSDWDPFNFVDWCQTANNLNSQQIAPDVVTLLQHLQTAEFRLLLDYSFQQALI